MKRPSSRTIAATAGALALSGVAVAAVATSSDDAPEPAVTEPAATQTDFGQPSEGPSSPPSPSNSPEPRNSTPDPDGSGDTVVSEAVTSEQAVAIAEQALAQHSTVPAVREVEREFEDGRDVWEVEFARDHEVYVDAMTGEVVKIEIDDDDDDRHDDDDRDDDYDDRDDDDYDDHDDD